MISYAEALAMVMQARRSLGHERVPLQQAAGRSLTEDVRALSDVPPFANSQMDGVAVRAADTPATFALTAKVFAGDSVIDATGPVAIMTGAPMPRGLDAVIKIEDVQGHQLPAASEGQFVRPAGEDFRADDVVVKRGTTLTPAALMALAACGHDTVLVEKTPRIKIIATGKELVMPGEALRAGQIWCSSTAYLQAYLPHAEAVVVADDVAQFKREMDCDADLIISTGAVSMGEHDFIPQLVTPIFHKVAIKPGKPILFAEGLFALPGNPISTAVCYHFFVRPFLHGPLQLFQSPLAHDVKKPESLTCFYKARVDSAVTVLEGQGSHLIRPLLEANAWVVLPEGPAHAGTLVQWLAAC